MAITGYKTDQWLVKTVGLLILAISVYMLLHLVRPGKVLPLAGMMLVCTAGLAIIDFYYSSQGIISRVYMVDGILQVLFFIAWVVAAVRATPRYHTL
jgi:uncharacterized membrane protein